MEIIKGKVTWIDILNPTKSDVDYLKTLHDFHPIILDELLHLSSRSKIEYYESYLYFAYHLPIYDHKQRTSRLAEIDFLITQKFVITIHYEPIESIRDFTLHLNQDSKLKEQILENGGYITYYILREIHEFCLRQLKHIEHNILSVTKNLFSHQEYMMLQRISYIKRDILDYGIIVKPQVLLLQSLHDAGIKFWGEHMRIYFSDLLGDHSKITGQLENFKETAESSEATNGQLLNAKTNSVMQRFTILAFLTFPLALYTAIFGIDIITKNITDPSYFWFGFLGVLGITLATIFIFKRKELIQ